MDKHYIKCGYGEIPQEDYGRIKAKKINLPDGYHYSGQYMLIGKDWYPIVKDDNGRIYYDDDKKNE